MASTLVITLSTQVLDGGQSNRGAINIVFNDGTTPYPINETLTQLNLGSGYFKEVPFQAGLETTTNNQQAVNYAIAFNRDHRNVGGNQNLGAKVVDNVITITAKNGIFDSAAYTGDILIYGDVITNGTIAPNVTFTSAIQATGDCSNVDYLVTASNELQPYTLKVNNVDVLVGWDGSATTIPLTRSLLISTLELHDANGLVKSSTQNVPRNLIASEFKKTTIPFIGYSDITINESNPVNNTSPIEYTLSDSDGANKGVFQVSNSFPNLLNGTYRLYIKDKYGCEVFKTISVSDTDAAESEDFKHLSASAYNSLSFAKPVDYDSFNKKNHTNTISSNENIPIREVGFHKFIEEDIIKTQFRSSYPFIVVTLFNCDGTKSNIQFQKIQQNIGAIERVDCKLFPIEGKIAVYFDGGNEYDANTLVVKNASPYPVNLPNWANVDQQVSLVSIGVKTIVGRGYDSTLQRSYFLVDGVIPASQDDIIQVVHNVQEYNLFQFYLSMIPIAGTSWLLIEGGYSFDEIDSCLISEPIQRFIDDDEHLLIEWEGTKNIGNMVYTNASMSSSMRVKGYMRPLPTGDSENEDGDDRAYPLTQDSAVIMKVDIPLLTFNQWDKLNKAATVVKVGTFKINGLEVVRSKPMEHDELGQTNLSNISFEFALGGESTSIKKDEIITNPSTGVTGSGSTGKVTNLDVEAWDGKLRLAIDGSFVTVDGMPITIE